MSEWIIDSRPTITDTIGHCEQVFVMQAGVSTICHYLDVMPDEPWMPITPPEPYVKPQRYLARYDSLYGYWAIFKTKGFVRVASIRELTNNNDQHREAAERIAATYDEVIP